MTKGRRGRGAGSDGEASISVGVAQGVIARVYVAILRIQHVLPDRVMRFLSSCGLGMLDGPALDAVTVASYGGKTGFESGEFNVIHGLWPWEKAAIDDALVPGMKVLVAGAGGGREAIALARLGYEVVAFDGSEHLVKACAANAKQDNLAIVALHVPYGSVPALPAQFDAVLIGRGVYHHIPGRKARVDFLKACRELLVPQGAFIMGDVLVRPETAAPDRAWLLSARIRRWRRGATLECGDRLSNGFFHRFTREEMERELSDSGFHLHEWREHLAFKSPLAHVLGRAVTPA